MTWSDLPFTAPVRTLRQFAGLWLVFFLGLAGMQVLGKGLSMKAGGCACLALVVGVAGMWRPGVVRPVFVTALVLTFPLGWLMSRLLLACLYYAVFTPLGLVLRLAGRDALGLRGNAGATSYWETKPGAESVRRYFRQF